MDRQTMDRQTIDRQIDKIKETVKFTCLDFLERG